MTQADQRTPQQLREALRRAGTDVERGTRAAPTEAEWVSLDRPPRSARTFEPKYPVPQDFLARQVLLSTVGTGLERFRRPDWLTELVEAGRPPREVFRVLRRRLPRAPSETAAREAQLIVNEFARLPEVGPSVGDELVPLLQDLLKLQLSTTTTVFAGPNRTGASRVFGVTRARRYHRVPNRELRDRGLDGAIGSLSLAASSDAANTCILFVSPRDRLFPDFVGPFAQWINRKDAGSARDVDLAGTASDDATRSLLAVATDRRTEFRLSFRDQILKTWNQTLDGLLAGSHARRSGDPLLTWDVFPQGIGGLNPNHIYLKIHQNLDVVLTSWPDYRASVTYHVFLFVNEEQELRGFVQRAAHWVEEGVKADDIGERLGPKVAEGAETLNAGIDEKLRALDGLGLNDVYYLPGRQLSRAEEVIGSTTDDVTIVVELA
jgi:hypothetical protein